jgi:hypothetical protein
MILDAEEERAQALFPHFFEKFRTDGVDHSIYVGASLHQDGVFDELYLRNLRIWQLMTTVRVEWELARIKGDLPVPLEATHLILVQHQPLSIRFRIDEKKFDVDGAYDIRYEIVKKRIDKALVRGLRTALRSPASSPSCIRRPQRAPSTGDTSTSCRTRASSRRVWRRWTSRTSRASPGLRPCGSPSRPKARTRAVSPVHWPDRRRGNSRAYSPRKGLRRV